MENSMFMPIKTSALSLPSVVILNKMRSQNRVRTRNGDGPEK